MLISRDEAQKFDREALFRFLELKVPEGAQVDYKLALSSDNKDESYREFLKDVTAFANATGGVLLIGVKEPGDNLLPEAQAIVLHKWSPYPLLFGSWTVWAGT